MKQIYLIRHAKSEWDEPYQTDEERGLSERGRRQNKALRAFLQNYGIDVDLALVSTAVRAQKTYQALRKEILNLPKPDYRRAIYDAESEDLLFLCHGIPNEVKSILIVGHNPGLEEFANGLLFGAPEPSRIQKFPTASFISLSYSGENWKDLAWGTGRLQVFWIPGACAR